MKRAGHLLSAIVVAAIHAACSDNPTSTTSPDTGPGGTGGHGSSTAGGGGGGEGGGGGSVPATCGSSVATDDYVAGVTKVGDNEYTVVLLESDPAPPFEGDNRWTVRVLDPGGEPLSGLTIEVYPFMPDHGHGTAVQAVVTPVSPDGTYEIEPLNLFMSGVWVVRLTLVDPATSTELDRVKYAFCVGP